MWFSFRLCSSDLVIAPTNVHAGKLQHAKCCGQSKFPNGCRNHIQPNETALSNGHVVEELIWTRNKVSKNMGWSLTKRLTPLWNTSRNYHTVSNAAYLMDSLLENK